jgi:hypothetical protein
VWRYLIGVRPEEIRRLPLVFNHIDELDLCQEAHWLLAKHKGASGPVSHPANGCETIKRGNPDAPTGRLR